MSLDLSTTTKVAGVLASLDATLEMIGEVDSDYKRGRKVATDIAINSVKVWFAKECGELENEFIVPADLVNALKEKS